MATVSPSPMTNGLVRRSSARQALRRPASRSMTTRSEHYPGPAKNHINSQPQSYDNNDDSSEDEIPVPMKLSALTKALLDDDAPEQPENRPSPPRTRARSGLLNASTSSATQERSQARSSSAAELQEERGISKPSSPAMEPSHEHNPVRKRMVRLSHTPRGFGQIEPSKRRSNSSTRATQRSRPTDWQEKSTEAPQSHQSLLSEDQVQNSSQERKSEVNTPAQPRIVRIVTGSTGKHSRVGSSDPSSAQSRRDRSLYEKAGTSGDEDYAQEAPDAAANNAPALGSGSISRYNRGRSEENGNPMSSMRIKRTGKLSGAYLSGPARRGNRRQSGKDGEEGVEGESMVPDPQTDRPAEHVPSAFFGDGLSNFNSGSPVSGSAAAAARAGRKHASSVDLRGEVDRFPHDVPKPQILEDSPPRIWVPKPEVPSSHGQENEVPASYKRTKPSVDQILEKIPQRTRGTDANKLTAASPERKVLGAISHNTPHRPAPPPPPKMSALDAATSAAGAAATTEKVRARRNILKVNGKCYTRLDCLGRGGSAKVYRVTDESGKLFALKRVSLENADELTVRGFKGEIDLLMKLKAADRVIDLIDYEMNEEKKILTMVMEMGEIDLLNFLRARQGAEARFDSTLVRFYWKEMLECVRSVHQFEVVHSDLKPQNFVLVKGVLKLIDFGIADAIEIDQTVNVHRENQIGTPNYMSPESLLDSNACGGRVSGRPRLMKLGKPSDVWSMGCILYQMVYGQAPFAHIVNHLARAQVIVNFQHQIDFPTRGQGGAPVPSSLLRTMRRCLNRDKSMRPTCEELLHHTDPFLYPAE